MNRKSVLYPMAVLLLLTVPGFSRGAEVTHLGTDFVFGFLENSSAQSCTVAIVNPDPDSAASATVSIPGLATPFDAAVTIPAAGSQTVTLPASFEDENAVLGISVTADRPVSVSGLSMKSGSGAGFLALPVPALGVEYFVLSYPGFDSFNNSRATLMVVAVEDATTVNIVTPVDTQATTANQSYSVVLNRLQSLTLTAVGSGDLTGTHVQSSAPVAVLGGTTSAWVPPRTGYADQLAEEMAPVTAWGTTYVGAAFVDQGEGGDVVRVLASEDNTTVTVTSPSAFSVVLDAGQYLDLDLSAGAVFEVQSTAPVGAAQYNKGSETASVGDTSMTILAATQKYLSAYDVRVPSEYGVNYAAVTLPDGATLTVDGTPASTAGFAAVGTSGYVAGSIALAEGSHRLTGSAPFGLQIYGSGTQIGYSYPAGYLFATVPDDPGGGGTSSGGGGGGGCFLRALGWIDR